MTAVGPPDCATMQFPMRVPSGRSNRFVARPTGGHAAAAMAPAVEDYSSIFLCSRRVRLTSFTYCAKMGEKSENVHKQGEICPHNSRLRGGVPDRHAKEQAASDLRVKLGLPPVRGVGDGVARYRHPPGGQGLHRAVAGTRLAQSVRDRGDEGSRRRPGRGRQGARARRRVRRLRPGRHLGHYRDDPRHQGALAARSRRSSPAGSAKATG